MVSDSVPMEPSGLAHDAIMYAEFFVLGVLKELKRLWKRVIVFNTLMVRTI